MVRNESPLGAIIKGAIAGLVGTVVGTVARKYTPQILQQLGIPKQQGNGIVHEATETRAEKVSEGVFEQRLGDNTRQLAGQAIRWTYGSAWGAIQGIVHIG